MPILQLIKRRTKLFLLLVTVSRILTHLQKLGTVNLLASHLAHMRAAYEWQVVFVQVLKSVYTSLLTKRSARHFRYKFISHLPFFVIQSLVCVGSYRTAILAA